MCLANVECERLNAVLRWQREPLLLTELSDLNLYRFWRKTGVAGVDACLLAAARYLGEAGSLLNQDDWLAFVERIARLLQVRFEGMATTEPLLDGKSLMRARNCRLAPGLASCWSTSARLRSVVRLTRSPKRSQPRETGWSQTALSKNCR